MVLNSYEKYNRYECVLYFFSNPFIGLEIYVYNDIKSNLEYDIIA